MIVDSSALVAILAREPEAERFSELIIDADAVAIAAPTVLETWIVLARFGTALRTSLAQFLKEARIDVVAFDSDQLAVAQEAYRRFGRGSAHPAGLNFGDCISYAAATVLHRPLLYKGDDFSHTDVLKIRPAEQE